MNENERLKVESSSKVLQFFTGLGLAIFLSVSGCCLGLWSELNIRAPRMPDPFFYMVIAALIGLLLLAHGFNSGKFQMLIGFLIGMASVWFVFSMVCGATVF